MKQVSDIRYEIDFKDKIIVGDALEKLQLLPPDSINCCITSPPYYCLRDYGVEGQIGFEETPIKYIKNLLNVFREVKRVLRHDGTFWLNMGDSYGGGWPNNDCRMRGKNDPKPLYSPKTRLQRKCLLGIPWRVALALIDDGWILRSDIIWSKPNPVPESVTDRPTKAHEYMFLFVKSPRYYYDQEAVKEKCTSGLSDEKNKRSVWNLPSCHSAHPAVFPIKLVEPCINAGCPVKGTVLDPFSGSGTTGLAAQRLGRHFVLIELNGEYAEMAQHRIYEDAPLFSNVDIYGG